MGSLSPNDCTDQSSLWRNPIFFFFNPIFLISNFQFKDLQYHFNINSQVNAKSNKNLKR